MRQGLLPLQRLPRSVQQDKRASTSVQFHTAETFRRICGELISRAREQIYVSGTLLTARTTRPEPVFRPALRAALERGVHITVLDDLEALETHDRIAVLEDLHERGADVRIVPSANNGVMIVDGVSAVICDNSARDGQGCASIRSHAIVASLRHLTDLTRSASWDLRLAPLLQGRDRQVQARVDVLRLLSDGYKDEVAARQLGMSLRTYRRHVADLISLLGARSRFEAGALAAKLGLVP